MKKIVLLLVLMTAVAGFVFSENVIELKKAELHWKIDGDALSISIEAETKGWLAVGLGSERMDGSNIFIGYSKNGEGFFEEHLGKGHSHKKAEVQRPVEYKVSESDGTTRIEFTVKKSDFSDTAKGSIPVIVAYGARDNFTSMHRYRDSTVITF